MPANNGRKPPHELVDLKLRNGWIVRDTESKLWRWRAWPEGESGGDIISWQAAGRLRTWRAEKTASDE